MALSTAVALTAACGGDGSDGNSPTPEATAAATPVASPATAAPVPCQTLANAKSFRYVSKVTLESPDTTETPTTEFPLPSATLTRDFGGPWLHQNDVDASVVTPDRFHFTIINTGDPPFDIIVIGQQSWTGLEGNWEPSTQPVSVLYQPIPVCEAILPELDLAQADPQREEIDDLETVHYSFLKNASPEGVGKVFGENSDMDLLIKALDVDLWLSDDGAELVRLELKGKGLYSDSRPLIVHLVLDVRDIDDENITVEPPI